VAKPSVCVLGAVESPASEYEWHKLTYWSLPCLAAEPLLNVPEVTPENFWGRLHKFLSETPGSLNRISPNFYKLNRNDSRLLCWNQNCDLRKRLETPTWRMKIVVKLRANRGKNYAFKQQKLRDCWTEVYQIWSWCSLVIAIESFESGFTMALSVVECRREEKGLSMRHLRTSPIFNWFSWQRPLGDHQMNIWKIIPINAPTKPVN